jgi:hypothetical protein
LNIFCWLEKKAGEIFTNLERLEGVLLDREGWRNIHKRRLPEEVSSAE